MHPYTHVQTEGGGQSLTVFMPSGAPVVATGDHPHFDKLLEAAQGDGPAEDIRALADLSYAAAEHFEPLSDRVSVANGQVFFDGDKVDSTITQQIVRCLEDPNVGDWKPLVLFMENVAANPNEHSREQLFDWLRDRKFTITTSGHFIAYKGVHDRDEDDGYPYQSSSAGEAIVDGERFVGQIPNGPGATVEMPRSDVQHDPSHGCSTGLHVGTYGYAETYAQGALLTVLVNPRDVVSVPTDCNAEKMRVCRYTVQDDDARSPEDSPVFAEAPKREPGRLYPPLDGAGTPEYEGLEWFVATGEERPAQSEFYLVRDHALYAYVGSGADATILEPTEPQHGDEKVEDGEVYFYLDCGYSYDTEMPRWVSGKWETQESFLAAHTDCGENN